MTRFEDYAMSADQIIRKMREEYEKGFGFVPFAGSGISSASGILMGQEFTNYLAWTLYCSLRDNGHEARSNRLNIRADGWPKEPKSTDVSEAKKWINEQYGNICRRWRQRLPNPAILDSTVDAALTDSVRILYGVNRSMKPEILQDDEEFDNVAAQEWIKLIRGSVPPGGYDLGLDSATTSEGYVIEQGIRSLYDWRATLHFLSSLHVEQPRDSRYRTIRLDAPDPGIVDSFNIHITRGRKHNLAHKMLTHLSRPLRTRVLLTTNFDTLLEAAFSELHVPLTVFQVGYHDPMPDAVTVRAQTSLIKLHGGLISTRADFSLDEEPNHRDKLMFDQYVYPSIGDRVGTGNHLLCMGFSGRDHRIIRMIRYVLENHDQFRLFWLCHSERDVARLKRLFPREDYRNRIYVHVTDRVDLFLYELYQTLNGSLPPGGFSYQFSHNVPPMSLHTGAEGPAYGELAAQLTDALRKKNFEWVRDHDQVAIESWTRLCQKLDAGRETNHSTNVKQLARRVDGNARRFEAELSHPGGNSVVVDGDSGVASLVGEISDTLSRRHRHTCVWLELEDYWRPRMVMTELLQILMLRRGKFQLEHIPLRPLSRNRWCVPEFADASKNAPSAYADSRFTGDLLLEYLVQEKRHLQQILDHAQVEPEDCYVFLYGRSGPGGCAGLAGAIEESAKLQQLFGNCVPRYWTNETRTAADVDDYTLLFLMRMLLRSVGFTVVYLPYSRRRLQYERSDGELFRRTLLRQGVSEDACPADLTRAMRLTDSNVDFIAEHSLNVWARIRRPVGFANESDEDSGSYKATTQASGEHQDIPSFFNQPVPRLRSIREKTFFEALDKVVGWLSIDESDSESRIGPKSSDCRFSWEKVRFLFAVTLFRISRHPAALYSEAVFPCPFTYNLKGKDNDLYRMTKVKRWANDFETMGVFYRKPGGYAWKHRDLRETIYCMLKGFANPTALDSSGRLWDSKHAQLVEIEAEIHFLIGNWYFKAFCSTGHHTPFTEALFHNVQSLILMHHRRPLSASAGDGSMHATSLKNLRFFATVLKKIVKQLRTAKRTITYWMQDDRGCGFFDVVPELFGVHGTGRKLLDAFFSNVVESSPGEAILQPAFKKHLEGLNDEVAAEMSETLLMVSRTGRDRDVGPYSPEFFPYALPGDQPQWHADDDDSNVSSKSDFDSPSKIRIRTRWKELTRVLHGSKEKADDFLDSSESAKVLDVFRSALRLPLPTNGSPDNASSERSIEIRRVINSTVDLWCEKKWSRSAEKSTDAFESFQSQIQLLVRIVNEVGYECLKFAKLREASLGSVIWHARYLQQKEDPTRPPLQARDRNGFDSEAGMCDTSWLAVCGCCLGVSLLTRELHPSLLGLDQQETIGSLTNYGLALGHLRRFNEAHRRLDEASALLSKAVIPSRPILNAIIHMRRCEVYLLQSRQHASPFDSIPGQEGFWEEVRGRDEISHRFQKRSRLVQTYLDNAWNALELATNRLSGGSRSGLWWGRLYTLRLRVIAESEVNCAADEVSPFRQESFHPLCQRNREDFGAMVDSVFRKAMLIAEGDVARTCRVIGNYATYLIAKFHPNRVRPRLFGQERIDAEEKLRSLVDSLEAAKRVSGVETRTKQEQRESASEGEKVDAMIHKTLVDYVASTEAALKFNIESFMTPVPECDQSLPTRSSLTELLLSEDRLNERNTEKPLLGYDNRVRVRPR